MKKILMLLVVIASISLMEGRRSDRSAETDMAGKSVERFDLDLSLVNLLQEFDSHLRLEAESGDIPGFGVAVVKDGKTVLLKGYGLREEGTSHRVDPMTVFRLASVSKGFAPVLTAILGREESIEWEDPIVKYLPDFTLSDPVQTRALTLEHVLSHQTGLPRHAYSNLLNAGVPYRDILAKLAGVELSHPVGGFYNYQNVAYSLVADVLEQQSGKPYDRLLEEYIFEPTGMLRASANYEGMVRQSNKALPHPRSWGSYRLREIKPTYYDVGPAAGVNASAADMAEWLKLLLGHYPDVISHDELADIFRPRVQVSKWDKSMSRWRSQLEAAHYALGWRVLDLKDGRRLLYHGGYVNGYRAEIALEVETGFGMAILSNAPAQFISRATPYFFELTKAYQSMPPL
ncbi:MAG: serine hydrolase domain-containing protein [Saprospiraceae bacterium]|nr:serine hydrolase domain-containing protein [Saprospiraceae bacterium]